MPFALVAAVVVALVITLTLVMPSLWLAGRAGARFGGQGAWWWPPAMGVAVSAGPVAVVGSAAWLLDGGAAPPATYLWWWLAIAALVVPAGLPAGLSRRRGTPDPAPGAHRSLPRLRGHGERRHAPQASANLAYAAA
ncbi:hypothetical protein ABZS71_29220 [Streptomyces sp. NPDC005393]|uniref:hypothetical protein n=1 Tax=Streptomyces sp. NPDC005393 TaxID=3157041 RepID=UPI00339FC573